MCLYKVGDLVHYTLDPDGNDVYIINSFGDEGVCTYDITLITSPHTKYYDVPQNHLTDTVTRSTSGDVGNEESTTEAATASADTSAALSGEEGYESVGVDSPLEAEVEGIYEAGATDRSLETYEPDNHLTDTMNPSA